MKKTSVKGLIILLIMLACVPLALTLNINECGTLNESITYTLTNDISTSGDCFVVEADNVRIDCNFHSITGDSGGIGIKIVDRTNVAIDNCIISNFEDGVLLDSSAVGIHGSFITNNEQGIRNRGYSLIDSFINSIYGNVNYGVYNEDSNALWVGYTWWGSNESTVINTTLFGNVLTDPWLDYDPFGDDENDGVYLIVDNCPFISNPNQTDNDGDNFGNICDNCVDFSNIFQEDNDNDTIGDACDIDDDNDGVDDLVDNCVFVANLGQEDQDNDNIGNVCDNCINTHNPIQLDSDSDGKGDVCDINLFFPAFSYDPLTETHPILDSDFASNMTTGYYVIQFNQQEQEGWELDLGLDINAIKPVPDFGWIIQTTEDEIVLSNIVGVRALVKFQPIHKITQAIYNDYESGLYNSAEMLDLMISLGDKSTIGGKIAALNGIFFDIDYTLPSGFSLEDIFYDVQIPKNSLLNLSFIPEILYMEKVSNITPIALDIATITTGVAPIGWNTLGLSGQGQTVGVLDDGFDAFHPDFVGRVTFSDTANHGSGHGTHTTGTVGGSGAAATAAGMPTPGFRGPAYNANIRFYNFTSNVVTKTLPSLNDLYNNGGRVHSNSWAIRDLACSVAVVGSTCPGVAVQQGYTAGAQTFDNFIYNKRGNITAVIAVGNFGQNDQVAFWWNAAPRRPAINTISSESTAKNVISVGASDNLRGFAAPPSTDNRNSNGDVSGYSSRGPTQFNRQIKPDVVAPGSWISATRASNVGSDWAGMARNVSQDYPRPAWLPPINNSYSYSSGTSMATPHVAGMAVLIQEWLNQEGVSSPQNNIVKAFIINGAEDMAGSSCGVAGALDHRTGRPNHACLNIPNVHEGWGRINLTKSIRPCDQKKCLFYENEGIVPRNGPMKSYAVRLSQKQPVEVTITWVEPGASGRTQNLLHVNLSQKGGDYYLGNHFGYTLAGGGATGLTIKGGTYDPLLRRENVQKIIIQSAKDGFYNLSVIPSTAPLPTDAIIRYSFVLYGIQGIDSINASGNYTYNFTVKDEYVYATAVGLPNGTLVNVSIVAYNDQSWTDNMAIKSVGGSANLTKTDEDGIIKKKLVFNFSNNKEFILDTNGSYNIVVDVNRDGTYDVSEDIVDYYNKSGFKIKATAAVNKSGILKEQFIYGKKVYGKIVGVMNNTEYNLYVVVHNSSFNWDKNKSLNGMDITGRADIKVKTSNLGVYQDDSKVILDTSTKTIEWLYNTSGRYNIVIDVNKDNIFDPSVDFVDETDKEGFRVGIINSSTAGGDFKVDFQYGDKVYASGVGFPSQPFNLYVFPEKVWSDNDNLLIGYKLRYLDVSATDGLFLDKIFNKTTIRDIGEYDIIADLDRDGKFHQDKDLIDGMGSVGFTMGCKENETTCGWIDSANTLDEVQDGFTKGETVKAIGMVYTEEVLSDNKLFIIDEDLELLGNDAFVDKSGGPESVSLFQNKFTPIWEEVWVDIQESGDFEIILDIDGNQKFDSDVDIYDPNGFYVGKVIKDLKFDIAPDNSLHFVVIEKNETHVALKYGKVNDSSIPFKANQKNNGTLFDWSNEHIVTLNVIDSRYDTSGKGFRISSPDIAVDSEGRAHIIYSISVTGGFEWIKYKVYTPEGDKLDFSFGESSPGANDGNPSDLLYYYWKDFYEPKLYSHSISIDPTNDLPVISANVVGQYPSQFYLDVIYPMSVVGSYEILPWHPLVPIFFIVEVKGVPLTYDGRSLQIARYKKESGEVRWPFGYRDPGADTDCLDGIRYTHPDECEDSCYCQSRSDIFYTEAGNEVKKVVDWATMTPRWEENWKWITIDEIWAYGAAKPMFSTSDIAVDSEGDVHIVYQRPDKKFSAVDGIFMYYSKVHEKSRNTPDGIRPYQISSEYTAMNDRQPSIDVDEGDSENVAHIVWQGFKDGEGYILYYRSDKDKDNVKIVANLERSPRPKDAYPTVSIDSGGNPHVAWVYYDEKGYAHMYYKTGNASDTDTNFGDEGCEPKECGREIILKNPRKPERDFTYSAVKIYNDTWTDKTYLSWLDGIGSIRNIMVKRTMPHTTLLISVDGLSYDMLQGALNSMPNLKSLVEENYLMAKANVGFPGTTLTSQAQLFTGLYPNNNKIIGDNFKLDGSNYEFVPDRSPEIDKINTLFEEKNIKTIFDYLEENGHSKAAVSSIVNKGVGDTRPDHKKPALLLWSIGDSQNDAEIDTYLQDIDNNDDTNNNDGAEFISVHLLADFDHGFSMSESNYNATVIPAIDKRIGEIVGYLKDNDMYKDTVIVITSDHGMADVERHINYSIFDYDEWVTRDNVLDKDNLYFNGKYAYYYVGSDDWEVIGPIADYLYNESFLREGSDLRGKVENIYVKLDGEYGKYIYNPSGPFDTVNITISNYIKSLNYGGSPEIILEAKIGESKQERHYFQGIRESMYGMREEDINVPFLITGPGLKYFMQGKGGDIGNMKMVDAAPTIAHLVGGKKLADKMGAMDGDNLLDSDLIITAHSPVYLHLYDAEGRHTGPMPDGTIEYGIPGSGYGVDSTTDDKTITLLKVNSQYRIEMEAYDSGEVSLDIKQKTDNSTLEISFPAIDIIPGTKILGNMIDTTTFVLGVDYDGDGTVDETIYPDVDIRVVEDLINDNAVADILHVNQGTPFDIDMTRSTDVILSLESVNGIMDDDEISVKKSFDNSFDSAGFYTLGNYLVINISDDVIPAVGSLTLKVYYLDSLLAERHVGEKGLSLYKEGASWDILSSSLNLEQNYVSAVISSSGRYLIASSEQTPIIENMSVTPAVTNIINDIIFVKAEVTDDEIIEDVNVSFDGATWEMVYNAGSGFYEKTITGPSVNGTHSIIVTALDNDNNLVMKQKTVTLDLVPPEITFFSPEDILYTTNHIELNFYVNEDSEQSYKFDSGAIAHLGTKNAYESTSVMFNVSSGVHSITSYANDTLGNYNLETINFEIVQQNMKITDLDVPLSAKPETSIPIKAKLTNTLMTAENNVEVEAIVDDLVVESRFYNISGEETIDVIFNIDRPEGVYEYSIRAVPLPSEPVTSDNLETAEIMVTDKIPILLVDDSDASINAYIDALDATSGPGFKEKVWDTSNGTPTLEFMDKFAITLWFTDNSLDFGERFVLKNYMDDGNYLAVFSDDLGSSIGETELYNDYLGAQYVGGAIIHTLEGVYRDEIGHSLLLAISGDAQKLAVSGTHTSVSFNYADGGAALVKTVKDEFKTLYAPFDLSAITDIGFRNLVFNRSLAWFKVDTFPPVIINKTPAEGYKYPIDSSNITIELITDEYANCRYSDSLIGYNDADIFPNTDSTIHSTPIFGLRNGYSYTYYIYCSDRKDNVLQDSINFYIWNRTFEAPIVEDIADIMIDEDGTINITIVATDPEDDPLTYYIEDMVFFGYTWFAPKFNILNNVIYYHTDFHDAGNYRLRVKVSDGWVNTTKEFEVDVINVNQPPVLGNIGDKVIVEDSYFFLQVAATDIDFDDLRYYDDTYLFDIHTFTGEISFNPKDYHIGSYIVNISVTDGELWDHEAINVTITDTNDHPVLDFVSPQYASDGQLFEMNTTAYDPDGDTLTFFDNTTMFDIDPVTGQIIFTPTLGDVGIHYISLWVSDGNLEDFKILNIVIDSLENQAPRFVDFPDNIVAIRNHTATLNITACDPDYDHSCT